MEHAKFFYLQLIEVATHRFRLNVQYNGTGILSIGDTYIIEQVQKFVHVRGQLIQQDCAAI